MSAQNLPGEEETVKGADIAPPGEAAIAQASEHDGIPRRYLPHRSFNQEDLRSYLGQLPSIINRWSGEAGDIFKDVETMCQQPCLFSTSSESANDDTYIEIYDVSPQGVVFRAQLANNQMHTPTALEYWQLIKVVLNIFLTAMIFFYVLEADTNQDDTIFNFRTYKDSRKNCFHSDNFRDFAPPFPYIFTLCSYAIIHENCQPAHWQPHDKDPDSVVGIRLSRCNAAVVLILHTPDSEDQPDELDCIYSPWVLLNLRFYPDKWGRNHRNFDYHQFYSGLDAFLLFVYVEVDQAIRRLEQVLERILELILPSDEFIFRQSLRDERLLDDSSFVWTKRYLWAVHVLLEIKQCISEILRRLEEITDRKRDCKFSCPNDLLRLTPNETRYEIRQGTPAGWFDNHERNFCLTKSRLEKLMSKIQEILDQVQRLQSTLYNGTAVLESRRTIQHGENVKLLTIVNCCFLPLTFITSVFGMTNMPQHENFVRFGIALAAVCLPLFAVIVFASSHYGYSVVKKVAKGIIEYPGNLASAVRNMRKEDLNPSQIWRKYRTQRTRQTQQSMASVTDPEAQRNGSTKSKGRKDKNDGDEPHSYPHIREIVKAVGERR